MQCSSIYPSLLSRWAELIDANDAQNVARYRNTLTGNVNSKTANGLSVEIHAATDKRAIGDAGVNQWRQEFDARLLALPISTGKPSKTVGASARPE